MMEIWAIANQKGGVGKTTTSICLARGLATSGKRVLLVDLDPHASATRSFGVPAEPTPSGTHEVFVSPTNLLVNLARHTAIAGLQLVAAQPALATLERRSVTQPGSSIGGRAYRFCIGSSSQMRRASSSAWRHSCCAQSAEKSCPSSTMMESKRRSSGTSSSPARAISASKASGLA